MSNHVFLDGFEIFVDEYKQTDLKRLLWPHCCKRQVELPTFFAAIGESNLPFENCFRHLHVGFYGKGGKKP